MARRLATVGPGLGGLIPVWSSPLHSIGAHRLSPSSVDAKLEAGAAREQQDGCSPPQEQRQEGFSPQHEQRQEGTSPHQEQRQEGSSPHQEQRQERFSPHHAHRQEGSTSYQVQQQTRQDLEEQSRLCQHFLRQEQRQSVQQQQPPSRPRLARRYPSTSRPTTLGRPWPCLSRLRSRPIGRS